MFIFTAKMTKGKAMTAIVAVGILLCVLIFAVHSLSDPAVTAAPPSPEGVSDNAARIAYLAEWGWEVEQDAVETLELTLPEPLDERYLKYNELQLAQGFDLSDDGGRSVTRYTYTICNYPDESKSVQADLYLCDECVIAGDILCAGENGFLAPLTYPVA